MSLNDLTINSVEFFFIASRKGVPPMGRPRKVITPEIMPAGSDQPRTKTVNAKHKIEYVAPVVVADEDPPDDDTVFDDIPEDVERTRKRKTAKDERDELRRDMDKMGVAPASRLKLTIEKYKHSDSLDSGVTADKVYCTRYGVTRDHVLNDDFLDVARQYGPGRYWLTLRLDNKVVRQWDREITMPGSNGTVIQQNPNDPNSPHIVVQMPENGHAPMPSDPFKEAERAINFLKKYNDALGLQPQPGAAPQRGEDEVLASALLKQPDVVENVVGNLVKRFGRSGGADDDPSWTSVAMEAIKTGQATSIIQTLIRELVSPFKNMWGNNGTPQMDQAAFQNQGPEIQNQNTGSPGHVSQIQNTQTQPQGATDMAQAGAHANGQRQISPADQALFMVLDACGRRIPPSVIFTNLMTFADAVNEQAPAYSIDGWIDFFAAMPIDDALAFVKTVPNGEQITALPHAKPWTIELQRLIKENQAEAKKEQ